MVNVIGVRFKRAGKVYYFDPMGIEFNEGEYVIVETVRGIEFGTVMEPNKNISEDEIVSSLKPVLRKADGKDIAQHLENQQKTEEARQICEEKIIKHKLDMKLTDVEFTFDNNKIIFYFTSDGRVDFRELVKDLAAVFRTRIELRQIGVRDEAKMLNGIGQCGRGLCCANWLSDFHPVSIKMAKEQNLSLNPTKISGVCGRLMCCLRYEYDTYKTLNRELPKYGERIKTPDGEAIVFNVNILKEQIKCKLITGFNKEENKPELAEDFSEYSANVIVRENKKRTNKTPKCKKNKANKNVQLQDQDDEVYEQLKALED